mgnify:CR=1 FL=1
MCSEIAWLEPLRSVSAPELVEDAARATPMIGHEGPFADLLGVDARYDARALLTAGRLIGPATLLRFYVLHCIFIPLIAAVLLIVHFWRVRKDGGISGPL